MKKNKINKDTFRKIESLKFLYEINPYGVVRNVKSKRILKQLKDKDGYFRISTTIMNEPINKSIHRLVAEAFIPNVNNYKIINHKDENKENNYYKNLEWCTVSYNNSYGSRLENCSETMSRKFGNILMVSTGLEFNNSKEVAQYLIDNNLCRSTNIKALSKNIRKYIHTGQIRYGSKWKRLSL